MKKLLVCLLLIGIVSCTVIYQSEIYTFFQQIIQLDLFSSVSDTISIYPKAEDPKLIAYHQLSDELQSDYRRLYYGIQNFDDVIYLKNCDSIDDINTIWDYLGIDHPELFQLNINYQYSNDFTYIKPEYNCTKNEYDQKLAVIDKICEPIIQNAAALPNDYEKMLYLYDTVKQLCEYQPDSEHDQNIQSVFLNHQSVCAGYARALQYLCLKSGIPCAYVSGYMEEHHAWNLALIDGVYSYFDITNDDNQSEYPQELTYIHFGKPYEAIKDSYTFNHPFQIIPNQSTQNSYYVRNGMYFDKYDTQMMDQLYQNVLKANGSELVFQAENESIGLELMKYAADLLSEPGYTIYSRTFDAYHIYCISKQYGYPTYSGD